MSEAGVTVVIPSWNRRGLLVLLLDRLALQTLVPAVVVVVDNGSTDGSAEEAERRGARVIRMGVNAGFSRAVNRGIQAADTEWIAVVNNDVEPAADWLERLVEAAVRRQAWFATGKVLDAGVRNRIDGTYDLLCRGACAWRAGHGRPDAAEFDRECAIAMAPATAALYRAELFRRAGEFDERFESYLEDVDFGLRAALAGCPGVYVPTAVAWHQGSATLGRWNAEVVRLISRNQVLLVAKHYPGSLMRRWAWALVLGQGLWGLLAARNGALRAYLRGKREGLRLFSKLRPLSFPDAAPVLVAGEREIHELQRRTGFDFYWRVYFLLTRGGTK